MAELTLFARSFTSALSLPEIKARLNEVGPWRWIDRDNDNYGEYISAKVLDEPHTGMLKIFVEPEHFVINVKLKSEAPDAKAAFDAVQATLFDRLLPAIGAGPLTPVDHYE
jgi:hypothetical protein